jgi:CO/xanthine dehydrogenase Mo-binding subunit
VIQRYYGIRDFDVTGYAALRQADDLAELPVFWEIGCAGAEVSVDVELGVMRVDKLAAIGDVGRAINPAMVEAQDLGAAVMGIGLGLREELRYDGEQLVNGTMLEYRVPRVSDVPDATRLGLAEGHEGVGPYGAKGGGEGAINPMPAVLANALCAATGVRVRQLPLSPETVWRALQDQAESRGQGDANPA